MKTVPIKELFLVLIALSAIAMIIVPEYLSVSLINMTQPAKAATQSSFALHRNTQLNPFGNLNASSNPNQFNIRSNVNPFPNLPSPGTSSPSTSSLSQNQYPYQYPYSYGYQSQPSSSPVTPQGSSQLQSQNQYPYPYQQGQQVQQQPQQQPLQTSPQPPSTVQPQQSQSSTLPSVTNPGQYQPQQQNQSSSSLTNAAQYPYQSQQQPQSSQSFTTGQPSVSTLIIVTHVNNTGSRTDANAADNFTQIVENTYTNPDGYANVYHYMKGSQIGVTLSLQPGAFSIYELNKNIKSSNPPLNQLTYDTAYSGDCRTVKSNTGSTTYGYGTINMGEAKTCTVTLSLHK